MILKFLQEFSQLSRAEQKVFLFCCRKLPNPVAYSGDIQRIALGTGLYYHTVRQALHHINSLPMVSRAVRYIRTDVSHFSTVSLDAFGEGVGSEMDFVDFFVPSSGRENALDLPDACDDEEITHSFPRSKK